MKVELTANEQIILASLVNREILELQASSFLDENGLIELYTNLRNKIIK
jgi:hypothetical protein